MRKAGKWMLAAGAALLFAGAGWAADARDPNSAGALLQKAWDEYGFQNWESTGALFLKVKADQTASPSQRLQAEIGEIFVIQYRAPGQDPVMAVQRWDTLLKSLDAKHPLRPFIMMHQAYAKVVAKPSDYEGCRTILREALALIADKKSNLAQEIILNYLSTYLMRYDEEQIKLGLAAADEYLPLTDGTPFSASARSMSAAMALIVKDYPRCIKETEAQYKAGILTRSYLESALYRLAKLNEMYAKDYQAAAKYYDLLGQEIPTSSKAYYAKMRAAELRKGVIESKLFEPGSDLDKDLLKGAVDALPAAVKSAESKTAGATSATGAKQ